jgi:hypothetical protein
MNSHDNAGTIMEAIKNGRTTTAVMTRESPEFLVGCFLEVSEVMGWRPLCVLVLTYAPSRFAQQR